jgi:hypothetical protein
MCGCTAKSRKKTLMVSHLLFVAGRLDPDESRMRVTRSVSAQHRQIAARSGPSISSPAPSSNV